MKRVLSPCQTLVSFLFVVVVLAACAGHLHPVPDSPRWLTYKGGAGPGRGKHIVLIAADQEYRSEEAMPMLARLLSARHGFDCTVLFAQNADGLVDPTQKTRPEVRDAWHDIPGIEHLATADLLVLFHRFITLPREQLRFVIDYLDSGKPLIGIRTANHGFIGDFPYVVDGRPVRFGEDVLGGTFRGHHGGWHRESTRGILVDEQRAHPILRGVDDIWGPSDVYRMYAQDSSLPDRCTALVMGQPLLGMKPTDEPNTKKIALPIAWTTTWTGALSKAARVFHVTMGSARDYESAGLRRLTVNAAYWCLGLEDQITGASCMDLVGPYAPRASGFDYGQLDVEPRSPAYFRE